MLKVFILYGNTCKTNFDSAALVVHVAPFSFVFLNFFFLFFKL